MKMKSVVMLAMSGLLAASITYILPAAADENIGAGIGQSMQTTPPSDSGMSSQNTAQNPSQGDMNSASTSTNDEGSPDTATGDDDY